MGAVGTIGLHLHKGFGFTVEEREQFDASCCILCYDEMLLVKMECLHEVVDFLAGCIKRADIGKFLGKSKGSSDRVDGGMGDVMNNGCCA